MLVAIASLTPVAHGDARVAALEEQVRALLGRVEAVEQDNARLRSGKSFLQHAVGSRAEVGRRLSSSPSCCRWTADNACTSHTEKCTAFHEYLEFRTATHVFDNVSACPGGSNPKATFHPVTAEVALQDGASEVARVATPLKVTHDSGCNATMELQLPTSVATLEVTGSLTVGGSAVGASAMEPCGVWAGNTNGMLSGIYSDSSVATFAGGNIRGLYMISDGVSDAYDNGNFLSLKVDGSWTGYLPYTETVNMVTVKDASNVVHSLASYQTMKVSLSSGATDDCSSCKNAWVAEFASASGAIGGIRVSGGLGADTSGGETSWELSASNGWKGYGKKVQGAGDASINHLMMLRTAGTLSQTNSGNTDVELNELTTTATADRAIFIMWLGASDYSFGTSTWTTLFNAIAAGCTS